MTGNVIIFTSGPPLPPPPVWPVFVMGALVILAALALAWWRRGTSMAGRPRRRVRVAVAATVGGGGGALMQFASSGMLFGGGSEIGWNPWAPSPPLVMFAHFLTYCLFAALLVGTTDLLFDALRPRRSLTWLVIGAPAFAAFITAFLLVTGWTGSIAWPPTRDQAILAVAALAGGLTWWAWLPASSDPVAHIFE